MKFINITRKLTISLFMGIFIGLGIFISYAVDITNIFQEINTGDRVLEGWFDDIRNKLVNIYSTSSGGNVGIGVVNPTQKLEVGGNIKGTGLCLGNDCKTSWIDTGKWSLNGSSIYYNSGSIGVGTDTPGALLDVNGQIIGGFGAVSTAGATNWNDITNSRSGNGYTLLQGTSTNGPTSAGANLFHSLNFEYLSKNGAGNITQLAIPYGNTSSIDQSMYMRGRYSGTWGNWVKFISENTSGDVGIGTNTPESKLHVDSGSIIISNSSGSPRLKLVNTSLGSVTTAPSWEIDNSSDTFRIFRQPNISTAGTAHLVISNSGKVGIGSYNPEYKLHVAGDILADGGRFRSSGNAGWVSETWGGGWYMSDATRLRTHNSKNVWTNTGTLGSNGGLTVGYGGAVPPTGGSIIAGNTGIGTSAPSQKLDVAGNIRTTGQPFINNTNPSIYLQDTDHRSAMIHTNSNLFYILRGDGINSTTYAAYGGYRPLYLNLENNNAQFGGIVYAPGGFTVSSDIRLKKNIKKIENPIEKIQKLNGYYFKWKESGKNEIGVVAQEVEKVFPEIVSESTNAKGESYKSVNYGSLVAPLIEAIKEQQKEIDNLKKRLKDLENK